MQEVVFNKFNNARWMLLSEALIALGKLRFGAKWTSNPFVKAEELQFYVSVNRDGENVYKFREFEGNKKGVGKLRHRSRRIPKSKLKLAEQYREMIDKNYHQLVDAAFATNSETGDSPIIVRVPQGSDIPLAKTERTLWERIIDTPVCTGWFPIKRSKTKGRPGRYGFIIISRKWFNDLQEKLGKRTATRTPKAASVSNSTNLPAGAVKVDRHRPAWKGDLLKTVLRELYPNGDPGYPAGDIATAAKKHCELRNLWPDKTKPYPKEFSDTLVKKTLGRRKAK